MMFDRKTAKLAAKELIKTARPKVQKMTLLYLIITFAVMIPCTTPMIKQMQLEIAYFGTGATVQPSLWTAVLFLVVSLLLPVLQFGYTAYTMKLHREQETSTKDLFSAVNFSHKVIGCTIMVAVFAMLWSLLFILPCAIVMVVAAAVLPSGLASLVGLIVYIVMLVGMVCVALRYSLAPYFLIDSDDHGVFDAIRSSKVAMKGNIGELFTLSLSFIGWGLLVGLIVYGVILIGLVAVISISGGNALSITTTMGMLLLGLLASLPLSLWLTAYQSVSIASFYDTVKSANGEYSVQ